MKFRVSPAILKTFFSGNIESVLTQCISVWYGNASNQDIYLKCCKSRADEIIKDTNHPGNHLLVLLPSGKRFRSMMAKTGRLRRSFLPQAIRLLNSNINLTPFNNQLDIHYSPSSILLLCIYPVQPVCTFFLQISAYVIIY